MSPKKYEVKVYNASGTFLTVWKQIVSKITFNNEINTAGGQMVIDLARNPGDYGEGTDIDFGYQVKVYCYDKEAPNGTLIFQGYISSYTPIYKDNKVQVTILSYGSQLADFMIEAGESLDASQLVNTSTYYFGNDTSSSNTHNMAQTITASGNGKWSRMELYLNTVDRYDSTTGTYSERTNVDCKLVVYAGTPSLTYTALGTSNVVRVANRTPALYSFTFTPPVSYTNTTVYTFELYPLTYATGSDQYMLAVRYGSGYASGSMYTLTNA